MFRNILSNIYENSLISRLGFLGNKTTPSRRELDTIIEIAAILTRPIAFNDKCNLMLEVLAHAAGADLTALRAIDQKGTGLELIAIFDEFRTEDSVPVNFALPLSNPSCPIALAFHTSEVRTIDDASQLTTPLPDYYASTSLSWIICPILANDTVLGVLGFGSRIANKFSPETVQLVTAITSTIGVLMENARLQQERGLDDEKIIRLARALEFTDDAIVLVDAEGNLEYMNKTAQELNGDYDSDSRDDDAHDAGTIATDESPNRSDGFLIEAVDGGWSGEVRRLDRTGNRMDISLATNHVTDSENRSMGHITVGRNVTENRRMQRDLIQLNLEREVEANIGRIISSPLDLGDVFSSFANELSKLIRFDRISINSVDVTNITYSTPFVFGLNIGSLFGPNQKPAEGSLTWQVAESNSSLIVNSGDPRYSTDILPNLQMYWSAGVDSLLAVPLNFGDSTVGVLILARIGQSFTDADFPLVERIGSMLSGALANYRLYLERDSAVVNAQENEARFRQIAENVRGGFWLSTLHPHENLYVSPAVGEVLGASSEDISKGGRPWLNNVHHEDRERIQNALERADRTGEFHEEFRIIVNEDLTRWVSNRGFPIRDDSGVVYRMGGFVEDITDRKDADLRLAESERLASIGELSAGVAHEINNPLTSIVLYSQMLLDEEIPESIRDSLQVVSSQAYRAAKIVRNMLQFARKSDPEKRPLSIEGLVRRSLEMKSHEFKINSIDVVQSLPENLPLIMMDEHLILQVLLNVLTNAEQACVSAHGRGNISISAAVDANLVDITIQDDGPGIPAERLAKIFEPFFTTKETGLGTGLGLSVSHGILSEHEGNIWAESDLGSGTTFHIELPLIMEADSNSVDGGSLAPSVSDSTRTASHVLVVDDERDLRLVLSRQLELRRYNVDQAGDGEEAWRKLQTLNYNCILLDIRMPGMGGQGLYEMVQKINPDLIDRIIFITGDTVNPATKTFLSSVSNPVLSKPFDLRELEQLVVSVINRNQGETNPIAKSTESCAPARP